ncbi:hypothetical protein [Amycolatopsis coloradensis]|uniref:hypothetical protein n=1 Tax=Amycolatopsis coloradensis TaxID=76021 RepID=UPI001177D1A1|nr:hypothetical protein [Amycolatopsis coloradensis]
MRIEAVGDGRLVIIARCLATTRLGACFRCVTLSGDVIDLMLVEIHRYPEVAVTELDPPHGARLVLIGTGADGLQFDFGDVLHNIDNPTA